MNCISWICRTFHKVQQVPGQFVGRVSRRPGADAELSAAEGGLLLTWPTSKSTDARRIPRVTEHQVEQSPRALSSQLQARGVGDPAQTDMTRAQTHTAGPHPSARVEPGLCAPTVTARPPAIEKVGSEEEQQFKLRDTNSSEHIAGPEEKKVTVNKSY